MEEGQANGGQKDDVKKIKAFRNALNFEINEYAAQGHNGVDLTGFEMEELYLIRLAIRRRMYATYQKIN